MLSAVDLPIPSTTQCPTTVPSSAKETVRRIASKSYRPKRQPEDDISLRPLFIPASPVISPHIPTLPPIPPLETHAHTISFTELPSEISEEIVSFLVGDLGPTNTGISGGNHGTRNWSIAMRHPRRKQLSDLALVSKSWRCLIQERLYRHSKLMELKYGQACADLKHSQSKGHQSRNGTMRGVVLDSCPSATVCSPYRILGISLGDEGERKAATFPTEQFSAIPLLPNQHKFTA